jgi:hypothetical protein
MHSFINEVHEAGHFLSLEGTYQPRLTDGFICVVLLNKVLTLICSMIYKKTTKIYIVDVYKKNILICTLGKD